MAACAAIFLIAKKHIEYIEEVNESFICDWAVFNNAGVHFLFWLCLCGRIQYRFD